MISVLSGGQAQDEVGPGILFFFLGVDQGFWLGIGIENSVVSRFFVDLMSPLRFLLLLG